MNQVLPYWIELMTAVTFGYTSQKVSDHNSKCLTNLLRSKKDLPIMNISKISGNNLFGCHMRDNQVQIKEVVYWNKSIADMRDIYICLPRTVSNGSLIFNGVIHQTKPSFSVMSMCKTRDSVIVRNSAQHKMISVILRMNSDTKLHIEYLPVILHRRKRSRRNLHSRRYNFPLRQRYKRNAVGTLSYTANEKMKPEIMDSSECGITRGCFRDGHSGCQHFECDYFLSYWTDTKVAYIELSGKTNGWIAVGFSSDESMGGDEILACIYKTNGIDIRVASYNDPHPRVRPMEKNTYATLKHAESRNGYMYCRFETPVKTDDSDVDLTGGWTQFYARGGITGGLMKKHTEAPLISKGEITIIQHQNIVNAALKIQVPFIIDMIGMAFVYFGMVWIRQW